MSATDNKLVLEGVGKTVAGALHLGDIDLTVAPGSFTTLVGRTGAGKSSLLRIIAGLDRPTTGKIWYGGADITRLTVRKRPVAMVYQQFVNYPSLTVFENIASPLRLQRASGIRERVVELAEMLHIGHLLERLPGQLSGGQQQRVAIARALAKDAPLLLLDEPLVNLDYKLREELREELRAILTERAVTVLYTTTEPGEALALGGDVVVMHEGRVRQSAPALEVYHRPADAIAARLFSDPPMNVFTAEVTSADGGGTVTAPGGVTFALPAHLQRLAAGQYRLGIRPSDCFLEDDPDGALVAMSGEVELSEISGSETFVYLGVEAAPEPVTFVIQEPGVYLHQLGEERRFYLDPGRLIAFAADDAGAMLASYQDAGAKTSAPVGEDE
ncbi:MAG: ABC transporter ATP-binding protein [Haliangiales bacterium]